MKKIVLLCAMGMSTSILVNNMVKEAEKEGFQCEISAFPIEKASEVGLHADCILIGPQVAYKLPDVQSVVTCPVSAIDMVVYGLMDGKKALDQAKNLIGVM